MTTLEPGAREVFTHGFCWSPASTAFFARSAAATITQGFDVLVHEVIAAMTTAPWSRSKDEPSASVTGVGLLGRPPFGRTGACGLSSSSRPETTDTGSLAGKDSADP